MKKAIVTRVTGQDGAYLAELLLKNELIFEGSRENERDIDTKTGRTLVKVNSKFYIPAEVELLIGDNTKAKKELQWKPKTCLEELCRLMVEAALKRSACFKQLKQ